MQNPIKSNLPLYTSIIQPSVKTNEDSCQPKITTTWKENWAEESLQLSIAISSIPYYEHVVEPDINK